MQEHNKNMPIKSLKGFKHLVMLKVNGTINCIISQTRMLRLYVL